MENRLIRTKSIRARNAIAHISTQFDHAAVAFFHHEDDKEKEAVDPRHELDSHSPKRNCQICLRLLLLAGLNGRPKFNRDAELRQEVSPVVLVDLNEIVVGLDLDELLCSPFLVTSMSLLLTKAWRFRLSSTPHCHG
jgi:hypothetical protein